MSTQEPERYPALPIDDTPLNERPSFAKMWCAECEASTTHKDGFCAEFHQGALPFDEPEPDGIYDGFATAHMPREEVSRHTLPAALEELRQVAPEPPNIVGVCMPASDPFDPVTKPSHYVRHGIELAQVVGAWGLGYYDGSAVKYLLRAKHKGDRHQDLLKAIKCIELELEGMN